MTCFWCRQEIEDARLKSGCQEPDYATVEGEDFGCDASPETVHEGQDEGCGSHLPEEEARAIVKAHVLKGGK